MAGHAGGKCVRLLFHDETGDAANVMHFTVRPGSSEADCPDSQRRGQSASLLSPVKQSI